MSSTNKAYEFYNHKSSRRKYWEALYDLEEGKNFLERTQTPLHIKEKQLIKPQNRLIASILQNTQEN